MRIGSVAACAALFAIALMTRSAGATPECVTIDEFNALYDQTGKRVTTLSLKFDVTGVNPADFFNSKGCLAEFDDETCTVGTGRALANVKVYGTSDPPNTSHPPGTIKFEYGTECCPAPPCTEGWADPNPSATVFVDGSEQCSVHVWIDPAEYGYGIDCGGTVFEAIGNNDQALGVTQVAILARNDGGWAMPNASSTYDEVCFEPVPPDPGTKVLDVPVLEDVTAAAPYPTSVYPDVTDLSVEAGDSETYLKFDLGAVPGLVTEARLFLHLSDGPSADGSGGDAFLVPDSSWSESTLTYGSRPATTGAALARVAPVPTYDWYGWDVSAAVAAPAVYSFAIVPEAADTNGAHFFSKEGNATLKPYLHVTYTVTDGDGDGSPAGPDCDDGDATVHPGATEVCNGHDDDCDGETDEGCAGAGGSGTGGADGGQGGGPVVAGDEEQTSPLFGHCNCRLAGGSAAGEQRAALGWLLCVVVAWARARCHTRRARP